MSPCITLTGRAPLTAPTGGDAAGPGWVPTDKQQCEQLLREPRPAPARPNTDTCWCWAGSQRGTLCDTRGQPARRCGRATHPGLPAGPMAEPRADGCVSPPQCAAATWPSRASSSRTRSTSAPTTTSSSTAPAVTAAGTSSPGRSSRHWAGPTTPSASSAAPAGGTSGTVGARWFGGSSHTLRLTCPCSSPRLQEAVPHWGQGDVQWEGLRLPELLPFAYQHQTHQDPWAQP